MLKKSRGPSRWYLRNEQGWTHISKPTCDRNKKRRAAKPTCQLMGRHAMQGSCFCREIQEKETRNVDAKDVVQEATDVSGSDLVGIQSECAKQCGDEKRKCKSFRLQNNGATGNVTTGSCELYDKKKLPNKYLKGTSDTQYVVDFKCARRFNARKACSYARKNLSRGRCRCIGPKTTRQVPDGRLEDSSWTNSGSNLVEECMNDCLEAEDCMAFQYTWSDDMSTAKCRLFSSGFSGQELSKKTAENLLFAHVRCV